MIYIKKPRVTSKKKKKTKKKKAPPIKHSVLISFQNHGEKLLEVGPTSKNIWHLRI